MRSLGLTCPGGITRHTPGAATREGQGREQAGRRQDLGHGPLLGTESGKLWGSQAKARLVNENQKQQGFGKLQGGVLPKRHTGVTFSQGLLGKLDQKLRHLLVIPRAIP